MKKKIEEINRVLAEWDPIGVGEDIASEEYKAYVPLILKSIDNRQRLFKCLEDILISMGLGYDSANKVYVEDLKGICEKLMQAYEK